eukprot:m.185387 g.185387  ORF g.185387 m.185387 type:complete len:92 (-) comp14728_c0_seq1:200-475(-)
MPRCAATAIIPHCMACNTHHNTTLGWVSTMLSQSDGRGFARQPSTACMQQNCIVTPTHKVLCDCNRNVLKACRAYATSQNDFNRNVALTCN